MRGNAAASSDGAARPGRRRTRAWPATALVVIAVLAATLGATTADAQSPAHLNSQINELKNQVVSLRAQLADLERVVHTRAEPKAVAPQAVPNDAMGERNSRRLAELETAIDETREWRRVVTGRFEELDNKLRRIEGRIERLVADVDFRLSALERGPGQVSGTASAAATGDGPTAEPATGQVVAGIEPDGPAGDGPSSSVETLGLIPADEPAGGEPERALTPDERYKEAFAILEAGGFQEAYDALTRFLEIHPAHELAPNASYWRCETLYARKMFGEAARCYALNLRDFPGGRKAPDNMVKLGMTLIRLERSDEACRTFAQLEQTFPDPPLNIRRAAQQGQRQANCP